MEHGERETKQRSRAVTAFNPSVEPSAHSERPPVDTWRLQCQLEQLTRRPVAWQRRAFSAFQNEAQAQQQAIPNRVLQRIEAQTSAGTPLPQHLSRAFGRHLNYNTIGRVRLHTDDPADQLAKDLGALAFTYGTHIFFQQGQYNPNTASGVELLAHELQHTKEQSEGLVSGDHQTINPDPLAELRAQQVASQVAGPVQHDLVQSEAESAAPGAILESLNAGRVQCFGDRGHHILEEAALKGAGFSEAEIKAIEQGNVQRDYSQVGTVGNALLLGQAQHFGKYSAYEHFDNSIWDPQTGRWRTRGVLQKFMYDLSKTDYSPIDYIEHELIQLLKTRDLTHLGNAFHTVEDFFAHSNFIELTKNDLRFGPELLTGSVPPGDRASVYHLIADISDPRTRGAYDQAAHEATAATEPLSHAHISKDTHSSRYYQEALKLAALVVQELGRDLRAILNEPQEEKRLELLQSVVLPKIKRYLRPPDPQDRWWEQLAKADAGALDQRLAALERTTPVMINHWALSPLRNIEASAYSPMKLPLGVAVPWSVGGGQGWIQVGVGFKPVGLPEAGGSDSTSSSQKATPVVGGQVIFRF